MLRNAHEREHIGSTGSDERAVFFDYLSWILVRLFLDMSMSILIVDYTNKITSVLDFSDILS